MGVVPLQFRAGDTVAALGLDGTEVFDVEGLSRAIESAGYARVVARRADGTTVSFDAVVRIDTPQEIVQFRHGGVLRYVVRRLIGVAADALPLRWDRATWTRARSSRSPRATRRRIRYIASEGGRPYAGAGPPSSSPVSLLAESSVAESVVAPLSMAPVSGGPP